MKNYLNDIRGKKVLVLDGLGFVKYNLIRSLYEVYECSVICLEDCKNSSPIIIEKMKRKY